MLAAEARRLQAVLAQQALQFGVSCLIVTGEPGAAGLAAIEHQVIATRIETHGGDIALGEFEALLFQLQVPDQCGRQLGNPLRTARHGEPGRQLTVVGHTAGTVIGFQHQHPVGGVGAQAVGQGTTGRAAPHDDEIIFFRRHFFSLQ